MSGDVTGPPSPGGPAPAQDAPQGADLVLGLAALVLFAVAFRQTLEWGERTALFPRLVTASGAGLALVFVVGWAVSRARSSRRRAAAPPDADVDHGHSPDLLDEDDVHDHEVEYVYATAGRAAWTQALAWVAGFVVLLWLSGLFVAAAVFAFTYLRWGAGRSWRFCAIYAAVLSGVLYLALGLLLTVPVPEGLFA